MKQTIINALLNQKRVTFVFDKDVQFSADSLINALPNDKNYIQVKTDNYADNTSRIINLSTVSWIRIKD
ncbi:MULTISPECIES: hypothetical protein [unclassified Enterococcus]|uniref:hypothetical protein n=1 Tax=unclassified Enterococcus TaxID=2608891 RepID=UPI0013ECE224|nr:MULTISPECIES: hypothetical protein [unclassified Enterococcus]